jgi:tripartite-type tricarboxylate transporter receptor subunit TctC
MVSQEPDHEHQGLIITFARANPGKLLFGSAGVGGLGHMAQELFRLQTGVTITHVPYKGTGPVMTALLTGECIRASAAVSPACPTSRPAAAPDRRDSFQAHGGAARVPTISETVPGYEVVLWYGIWGPKGMPKGRRPAPERGIREGDPYRRDEDVVRGRGHGNRRRPARAVPGAIRSDIEKWKKVVKEANIKVAG